MFNKSSLVIGISLVALIGCREAPQVEDCVLECTMEDVLVSTQEVCEFVEVQVEKTVCVNSYTFETEPFCNTETVCGSAEHTYSYMDCEVSSVDYPGITCESEEYSYVSTECDFSEVEYGGTACDDGCIHEHQSCNNGGGNDSEGCSPSENGNDDESYVILHPDGSDHSHGHGHDYSDEEVCYDYEYTCDEAACQDVELTNSVDVCIDSSYTCDEAVCTEVVVTTDVEVCVEDEDCGNRIVPVIEETCQNLILTETVEVCSEETIFERQEVCDESSCDTEWVQGGGTLEN